MSAMAVFVVAAPPDARLVASVGRAVEPLVHAPETVQSAGIGGIGVIDGAVPAHERAHARPLAGERGRVGSASRRHLDDGALAAGFLPRRSAPIVVVDTVALLLLGEPDAEVEVEVAAEGGRPGKRPAQPPLVRLQL